MAKDTQAGDVEPLEGTEEMIAILHRIEHYCKNLPPREDFQAHWLILKEIHLKSAEGLELETESKLLLRDHIKDMKGLKELQAMSISQTKNLVEAQDRLATILDNISANLENGFKLGGNVVKLFGRIVLVFLASLIILSLVIVWIARIDITYSNGKGSLMRHEPSKNAPTTP